MSREEQKRIRGLATEYLSKGRSKEEIVVTLRKAGIVDSNGKVKAPYNNILTSEEK